MGIDLKPCPFCGCDAEYSVWSDHDYHRAECSECDVTLDYFTSAELLEYAWNRRSGDAEITRLRAELAAKSKECDALRDGLEAVYQYGSDTLRGPTGGTPDDRKWQRQAVLEMTNRASRTIDSGSWKGEGNGR